MNKDKNRLLGALKEENTQDLGGLSLYWESFGMQGEIGPLPRNSPSSPDQVTISHPGPPEALFVVGFVILSERKYSATMERSLP